MEPAKIIETLWERIQARDWSGVGELLVSDVVVEWPVSAERIVGRENFLRVNSEYPEGWSIHVQRIVADGDQVVSEVEVPHEELGVFHAASFWTVRDGLITAAREYWTSPGTDPSPTWRHPYVQPL